MSANTGHMVQIEIKEIWEEERQVDQRKIFRQ
jgi:hypothetical protein